MAEVVTEFPEFRISSLAKFHRREELGVLRIWIRELQRSQGVEIG